MSNVLADADGIRTLLIKPFHTLIDCGIGDHNSANGLYCFEPMKRRRPSNLAEDTPEGSLGKSMPAAAGVLRRLAARGILVAAGLIVLAAIGLLQ